MVILCFVIGCCIGSFMNVVLLRRDWYCGRSRCDWCGYTLKWYDLIPIISFCLLKGRCRKCHSKIDTLHLASEIYVGCGFMAVSGYYKHDLLAAVCITAAVLFLGIFAISDTKENAVSVLYLYGGLLCVAVLKLSWLLSQGNLYSTLAFIGGYGAVYLVFRIISKKAGNYIGEGDFDIFMLILMVLGFYNSMLCLTIASLIGTSLYLPLVIRGKFDRKKPIPLAPLLYVGFIITILGGI